MAEPLRVREGEMSVDEVIDALNDGRRVIVRTEFLDSEHEITLRWDGDIYYCDTPTQLHKHADEAEMRECIENQGYSRPDEDAT